MAINTPNGDDSCVPQSFIVSQTCALRQRRRFSRTEHLLGCWTTLVSTAACYRTWSSWYVLDFRSTLVICFSLTSHTSFAKWYLIFRTPELHFLGCILQQVNCGYIFGYNCGYILLWASINYVACLWYVSLRHQTPHLLSDAISPSYISWSTFCVWSTAAIFSADVATFSADAATFCFGSVSTHFEARLYFFGMRFPKKKLLFIEAVL